MKQIPKTALNTRIIAEIFFYLCIFNLFFPIRYIFLSSTTFATGIFSDFTSISLYLSDIFLLLTVFWLILTYKWLFFEVYKRGFSIIILIIWLILGILWHFDTYSSLNAYYFIKFLEFIVAYGTIALLFQETGVKSRFFKLFAVLASIQAIIALRQFATQQPVGLFKLGEQQVYTWNQGIAKLIVGGVTYIRGYGTFPHPNLLSAFLLTGVLVAIPLFLLAKVRWQKVLWGTCVFINILGLFVTFSRASLLALAAGLVILFGYLLIKSHQSLSLSFRQIVIVIVIVIVSITAATALFRPFLLTRATVSDSASLERIFYAKVGWQMIKANPVFGVGVGESVLHMQQYSPIRLWPWQIQPIHNYYEISAAELGLPGALILFWIFLSHVKSLILQLKSKFDPYYILLTTLLLCFLILMMFDHYFYTLQQTQLLLWLLLGAIAAEINHKYENSI